MSVLAVPQGAGLAPDAIMARLTQGTAGVRSVAGQESDGGESVGAETSHRVVGRARRCHSVLRHPLKSSAMEETGLKMKLHPQCLIQALNGSVKTANPSPVASQDATSFRLRCPPHPVVAHAWCAQEGQCAHSPFTQCAMLVGLAHARVTGKTSVESFTTPRPQQQRSGSSQRNCTNRAPLQLTHHRVRGEGLKADEWELNRAALHDSTDPIDQLHAAATLLPKTAQPVVPMLFRCPSPKLCHPSQNCVSYIRKVVSKMFISYPCHLCPGIA